ncbi:hypothetical protein DFQ48_18375, partial [Clostridioides difficile]|nr:hypothetical protein [Clostridioides difficile]EGT4153157.1 hypothetical protein [Clostridioides difficile]EGT4247613.1 hypothetical protein [Clostridioides difficile]EGT4582636.1 hypothetical protein [Clostridioides difficile]
IHLLRSIIIFGFLVFIIFLYLNITKNKRLLKLSRVYFILINNKAIFLYIGIIYAYLTMKLKLNRINEEEKNGK